MGLHTCFALASVLAVLSVMFGRDTLMLRHNSAQISRVICISWPCSFGFAMQSKMGLGISELFTSVTRSKRTPLHGIIDMEQPMHISGSFPAATLIPQPELCSPDNYVKPRTLKTPPSLKRKQKRTCCEPKTTEHETLNILNPAFLNTHLNTTPNPKGRRRGRGLRAEGCKA